MTHADDVLRCIAADSGVFLRREAVAHGLDDRGLRRAVLGGELTRVRQGAYVHSDVWSAAVPSHRLRILTRAVQRMSAPGSTASSHHSGAADHGLDLWDVPFDVAHVTRLDGQAGRRSADAVHHEALALDGDVVERDGSTLISPARAALESAMLSGVERGLVTVDSGLCQDLFSVQDLWQRYDVMAHWPNAQGLQIVTRLADGRSKSTGESRSKYLFFRQALPKPELQYEIWQAGVLLGITDFCWPEHGLLGEFDGREKYLKHLKDGEAPQDALWREKQREDLLRRVTGWAMVRLVWADLYHPARTASYIRSLMRRAA